MFQKLKELIEERNSIEREIYKIKHNCGHANAVCIGEAFDTLEDEPAYYACIYCPDCDSRFYVYDKEEAKKYPKGECSI